jgi:glucokinase
MLERVANAGLHPRPCQGRSLAYYLRGMDYVLAGDIGGTKTALSLFVREGAQTYREVASLKYPSADYSGLGPIVRQFLQASVGSDRVPGLRAASFGVAGAVERGVCKTTNLPWTIDAQRLSETLGAPTGLINDFHAVALGIGELAAQEFVVLQEGVVDSEAPSAILGAGTGLGEAIVVPTAAGIRVIASEGGHVDLAPRTPLEVKLLEFLWRRHHRVSVERAVSGTGLRALYEFVLDAKLAPESESVRAQLATEDAGKVIGEHGVRGSDAACERALDMFVSLYGAEAGNLALKVLPHGGLYVAGGVAPKIIDKLRDGSFMRAFLDKGRLSPALERVRVSVLMNPRVGLLGARKHASQLADRDLTV